MSPTTDEASGGAPQEAPQAPPKPKEVVTIGRSVHFVMPDGKHRSATVVEIGQNGIEDSVELVVFLSTQDSRNTVIKRVLAVPFDEGGSIPYSWHWPERIAGFGPIVDQGGKRKESSK